MTIAANRSKTFWAFAAIYLLWGSTYLAIQVAIGSMPPFTMAAVRFIAAGVVLYLWARLRGEPAPPLAVWRAAALFGALFFVIGSGLVVWSEQFVPSGRAALLASTTPIWMVVIDSALAGWRRPPNRVLVGIAIGMVGLALLMSPQPNTTAEPIPVLGILALLVAAIGWGGASVWSHRRHLPGSPMLTTGMKMIAGGTQLGVVALLAGEGQRLNVGRVTPASWLALGYLIVFGSIVGFSAFTYLLRVTTPAAVGTSAYVNPVVALFLGWALAGEIVTAKMLVGAAVSLVGVLLIRWPTARIPAAGEVDVGAFETGEFPLPHRSAP